MSYILTILSVLANWKMSVTEKDGLKVTAVLQLFTFVNAQLTETLHAAGRADSITVVRLHVQSLKQS